MTTQNSKALLEPIHILKKFQLQFLGNVPERLHCKLCCEVLINAKQTSCGCKFCESCIKSYLKDGCKECPNEDCDEMPLKIDELNPDVATNKEIQLLRVKCPFDGCEHEDRLKDIPSHIEECEYRDIDCPDCGETIQVRNKKDHNVSQCEMRSQSCPYCKIKLTALDLKSKHLNYDCDEFCSSCEGICPNGCGLTKPTNLKQHFEKCSNRKIDCPYQEMGCKSNKVSLKLIGNHLNDEIVSHTQMLTERLKFLENENRRLVETCNRTMQIVTEMTGSLQKLTSTVSKLENEAKVQCESNAAPVIVNTQTCVLRNGTFIWKIKDFKRKMDESKSNRKPFLLSDPFYTSEHEYKLCLKVFPAGDGIGKGTHLSVFFTIMKGEYDDILPWPFKHKITLTLLQQENNLQHLSESIKPDMRSSCYLKPIDEYNIASGAPKLITLKSLIEESSKNCYYKNDSIFIKIVVDV